MTATISAYGRLGQDPKEIATASGKAMAVASLAVDVSGRSDGEAATEWFGVVAFGRLAEELLRHAKGDPLSVTGRLQVRTWTGREGEERRELQIVADALVSARTVRPGAQGKSSDQPQRRQRREAPVPEPAGEVHPEFDDAVPF